MNNEKLEKNVLIGFDYLEGLYQPKNQKKWLRIALEREIVPLRATPELAQICGHLIGDGHLRLSNINGGHLKFFGEPSKLKDIAKLYGKLFNKKIKLVKRDRILDQGYKLEFTDSAVVRCLHKIGVPAGDKVLTEFEVPSWVLNGEKEIKRRFIQALFDDELEGLYAFKDRPNSWKGLRLRMNKCENLAFKGLKFFNQIIDMLNGFGIETTPAKVYNNVAYIRPDGTKTYTLVFRVKQNLENRRKFLREIGFIYDKRKQENLIKSVG